MIRKRKSFRRGTFDSVLRTLDDDVLTILSDISMTLDDVLSTVKKKNVFRDAKYDILTLSRFR